MFSIESRFSGNSSSFAELLLEVADELEHAGRVDQPGFDERVGRRELGRIVAEKVVGGEKLAQIVLDWLLI